MLKLAKPASDRRQGRAQVAELRREHTLLIREYGEARACAREYSARSFLRPGERLEARTLERMSHHKREALGDVGRRLSQLEARVLSSASEG